MKFQYSSQPKVLDKVQFFLVMVVPVMIFQFLMDIFRELHLGVGCYISAFVCELGNSIVTVGLCYTLGFLMDLGFTGILCGSAIGQFIGYILYLGNFNFSPSFRKYHQQSKKVPDEVENELSIFQITEQVDLNEYDKISVYLKYCLSFSLIYFLENSWFRIDTIYASFIYDAQNVAALTAFFNVCVMFDCFSFGFGFATSAAMSEFLVKGQVRKAKVCAVTACICSIVIGLLISIPISIFSDYFAV